MLLYFITHKLCFCLFAIIISALAERDRFPNDFLFGASTSAFQTEGAWNVDGKGPSFLDDLVHTFPESVIDQTNAEVGPNSYEYYLDDLAALKDLGMQFYRFSIAWSRVLPNGDFSNVNEKGIEHYNKIIDKLLALNIEPMITMFHFDLPLNFKSIGAFSNSEMIQHFKAYAKLLFERFGDRVKYWITFNEPQGLCSGDDELHGNYNGVACYLCGHNILKSHAVVYHLYQQSFYDRFRGQVGISLNSFFFYSVANDTKTVDHAMQFMLGWFAAPLFSKSGNYPAIMIEQIARNSKLEGRSHPRLPVFSKQWIDTIRGSADFLGLNYYTSRFVENLVEPEGPNPSYRRDRNLNETTNPEWKRAASNWLFSVPQGLGDILRWIKNEYNNPDVFITETGWSDKGELEDNDRIEYLHDHLHQIQNVIQNDSCNLKGYSVWSLIDSFEFFRGYTERFGLYSVNMTSPMKERSPKKSAGFMQKVTKTRAIPPIN